MSKCNAPTVECLIKDLCGRINTALLEIVSRIESGCVPKGSQVKVISVIRRVMTITLVNPEMDPLRRLASLVAMFEDEGEVEELQTMIDEIQQGGQQDVIYRASHILQNSIF